MITWSKSTWSIGSVAAFVIAIVVLILWALGQLPKEWALLTCAVCANKL